MPNKINLEIKLCCPCHERECDQKTDNHITKEGLYTTTTDKPSRPRCYCHGGKPRVSETRYSEWFGFGGTFQESEPVTKLSTDGWSREAIAESKEIS